MSATEVTNERRYQLCLRCLFGFALLVRLGFVLVVHPPGQFVFSDMQSYDSVAFELVAGITNPWHAFRPVGYSMLLAFVYRLTDGSRTFVGVLQALMSAALVPYAAELARAAGARRLTAFWVALLVAFSLPLVFYSGVLLTEIPTTFCLVWGLKQAITLARTRPNRLWPWCKLGLALGLAGVMRPNLLPLVPVVLLYVLFAGPVGWLRQAGGARRRRLIALLVATLGCAGVVGLVSAYNSRALGRRVGPSANGGINFYLNFADVRSVHYSGAYGGYWISPVPNGLRFTRDETTDVPFFDDAHYYRAGMRFVRAHPDALLRAFSNYPEAFGLGTQLYWPNWPGHELRFRGYARLFFVIVLGPGLWQLLYLGVQWVRRRAQREALLLAAVCAVGSLPMYFFLGDPRVRVPFDPLWVVLSGLAFQQVWTTVWGLLRRVRSPA